MDPAAPRRSRLSPNLFLTIILIAAGVLHWVPAGHVELLPDDLLSMEGSRRIAAGEWRLVLSPLEDHLLPLYRLVRVPFDLHFPEWYLGFHALVLGVHLAGTVLLYLLAHRYLGNQSAALVTATLFAWSRVGEEALLWKVASPYAFSWTFLLFTAWCLTRKGAIWSVAAAAGLGCAVGFFFGALFAIPGLLLGVLLLEPNSRKQALAICAGIAAAGSGAWAILVRPHLDLKRYELAGPAVDLPARLLAAATDTFHAYAYQLGFGLPVSEQHATVLVAVPFLALLALRRHVNGYWILSALILTALPLFAIMIFRQAPHVWKISRYGYQGYAFWCIVMGSLFSGIFQRFQPRASRRTALLAATGVLAAVYLNHQISAAKRERDALRAHPVTQLTFWSGWDRFFRLASAHRTELGSPLEVPPINLHPHLNLHQLFSICHPRGLPGLTVHPGLNGTEQEREEFWREVDRARPYLPGFDFRRPAHPSGVHAHDGPAAPVGP